MDALTPSQIEFIERQQLFFVATAAPEGRVNMSPKGMDTLRVMGPQRIVWLNLTGSGNETAAHVAANGRMTMMFVSFTDKPLILRAFGSARAIHPRDEDWDDMISMYPTLGGSRQIFDMTIDKTRVSCGTGVPVMEITSTRADTELEPFYAEMSDDALHAYWSKKNTLSIDGFQTGIFAD